MADVDAISGLPRAADAGGCRPERRSSDGQAILVEIMKTSWHAADLRFWVELRGFEPLTPSMRTKWSQVHIRACPCRWVRMNAGGGCYGLRAARSPCRTLRRRPVLRVRGRASAGSYRRNGRDPGGSLSSDRSPGRLRGSPGAGMSKRRALFRTAVPAECRRNTISADDLLVVGRGNVVPGRESHRDSRRLLDGDGDYSQ